MSDDGFISRKATVPASRLAGEDTDPLAEVGNFVLELIRKRVARESSLDELGAALKERTEAIEARIGHYRQTEQQAALFGTLLNETRRDLHERTEEAHASYRKFVDAAAQLRSANEEVAHLKTVLQNKEREIEKVKHESQQMMSYVQSLISIIESSRPAGQRVDLPTPPGNFH